MIEPLIDETIFNPETGEIIEEEVVVLDNTLPKYARACKAIKYKIEQLKEYRDKEVNRIIEICDHNSENLQKQLDRLTDRSMAIMRMAGEEKVYYPGLGRFRFGLTRLKVNDEAWDGRMNNNCIECFKSETKITPVKKIILDKLKKGEHIEGFSLEEQKETFIFKEE